MLNTYSPFSKSYRATEKSSLPATRYLPSCDISIEFISFYYSNNKIKVKILTKFLKTNAGLND
jgi:hypothetical protein